MNLLKKIDDIVTRAEKTIMIASGSLILIISLLNVFDRYVIKSGLMNWYMEVVILLNTVMIFWGASHLARDSSLMQIDFLASKLKAKKITYYYKYKLIRCLFCLIISILGIYCFSKYALLTNSSTVVLKIPSRYSFFFTFVLGFVGLTLRYMQNVLNVLKSEANFKKEEIQ